MGASSVRPSVLAAIALVVALATYTLPAAGQQLVQLTPDAGLLPPGHSYHTFDLLWHGPFGPDTHWTSSVGTFTLTAPSLSFYQAQGGDAIAQLMPPLPSAVAGDPALAWDTFLAAPFAFPNVNDDALVQQPVIAMPPLVSAPQLIDVVWGVPLLNTPTIPYTLARFTVQGPIGLELTLQNTGFPVGTIFGTTTTNNITGLYPYGATIYVVPEPAGWIGLIGLVLVLRRR
jgi:hypothetical protein